MTRNYSNIDRLIGQIDQGIRTVFGHPVGTHRTNPAHQEEEVSLTDSEAQLSGRLLRIDHAGEVCAQALYQSQALTARSDALRSRMEQAAMEENDHLQWCDDRLQELNSHKSYLNPLWYSGSFAIGTVAGLIGDRWNLGFVAETERQVVTHLEGHLQQISPNDCKSRAILEQMKVDENQHATKALAAGGRALPRPICGLMKLASKIMTGASYWV